MLNKNEAEMAIKAYYLGVENFLIGAPVPFVRTYTLDNQFDFNNLTHTDQEIFGIFYGEITWSMYSNVNPNIAQMTWYNFAEMNILNEVTQFFIIKNFITTSDFSQGTTKGMLIQRINLDVNTRISLDGYFFPIAIKKIK